MAIPVQHSLGLCFTFTSYHPSHNHIDTMYERIKYNMCAQTHQKPSGNRDGRSSRSLLIIGWDRKEAFSIGIFFLSLLHI